MKKILSIGFIFALVATSARAGAFYEGFSYTPGALAGSINTNSTGGNQSWGASTTAGPDNIVNASTLSYSGLPAATGNSGMITNFTSTNAKVERIGIGGLNGNASLFYSCLVNVADLTGAASGTTGSFQAGFGTDAATSTTAINNAVGRLQFRKDSVDGTKFNFGIRCDNSTATGVSALPYETVQRTVGTTYFVVVEYEVNSGSLINDVSKIWINPAVGASNTAPDMTSTGGDLNTLPIKSFFLRQNTSGPRQLILDELRIGRTWEYVMGAPEFDSQPANRTNNALTSAVFTATVASSGAAVNYQWQKNGANLTDGGNISGATTTNLTLVNVLAGDAGNYTLIASNALGVPSLSVTSSVATLTVVDPFITAQPSPASQTQPPGVTVNYSVTAVGTATITYQWWKDGAPLSDGGVVSGSTTANLALTGITTGDAGTYSCRVTNGLGSGAISSGAALIVLDPAITSAPTSVTTNYGSTATFSVTVAGTAPFTYQWRTGGVALVDGGNISGSTSSTLTVSSVSYLDAGSYTVVVTNGNGNGVTSSVATLTVRDPAIIAQPSSLLKAAGASATFSVTATGSALAYQWKKGSAVIADGGKISGATTSALTISGVTANDADSYTVVVTNNLSAQTVTSSAATLSIVDPPSARTVAVGVNVGFSPAVTGAGTFTYQWKSNGIVIPGATSAAYVLANVQPSYSAIYSVDVTTAAGTASGSGVLTVVTGNLVLYETNLVVLRLGDGAQTPATSGNSLFLDQYTTSGAYVNSTTLPDTGANPIVGNPNSTTSGALTRSLNGKLLCFAGYDTNTANFGSGVSIEGSSAVFPRVIGTVDALSAYNRPFKSSSTTVFSSAAFRAAVTDGTNNFWGSGANSGTLYFTPPSTVTVIQNTKLNMRVSEIFNGDLYFSCASTVGDSHQGIYKFTGLPTAATPLPTPQLVEYGALAANGPMDFAVNPAGTILYGCDDRNPNGDGSTGGIRRYDLVSGSWVFSYTLTNGLLSGTTLRHMTVDFSGANPVLYATTSTVGSSPAQNLLVKVVDTGYQSGFITLASAGGNQTFKGVKFGPAGDPPVITSSPASRTNNAGTTATFTVAATGMGTLGYRWTKDGSALADSGNVSGATSPTLTLASVSQSDVANYAVVITNEFGSVTSAPPASLTVIDPPLISVGPASRTNVAGTLATFTVTYSGSTPTFAWSKNGSPLSDAGNVSGSSTATLSLSNVQDADAASYTVTLSNAAGTATSDPATLTVIDPPSISVQPASRTNFVGSTATFSVTASGSPTLTYQWIFCPQPNWNVATNILGATNSVLSLANVQLTDAGSYLVVVSNAAGSVTSAPPALLTVLNPPAISDSVLDGSNLIFSGSGGIEGAQYYVLTSANVTEPVANWISIQTNTFGPGGTFSVTNAVNPGQPAQFFQLQVP
jgi:hypothetical protein